MNPYDRDDPAANLADLPETAVTRSLHMKMAKASAADIEAVNQFVADLENAVERGEYTLPGGVDVSDRSDGQLGRFVRAFYRKHGPGLFRVTFGYQVIVDAACDPAASTLEWKPEIAAKLEAS